MPSDIQAVIDFETTGLSPGQGARAIEVAVVLVSANRVVDTFSSLMNPGVSVPYEITQLTGITPKMVKSAPLSRSVIHDVTRFIGKAELVAHNASFDRKFLEGEQKQIGITITSNFVCTMLLSRRIFQGAPNHQLGTLVRHLKLPTDGNLHRALADAQVTAELLFRIQSEIATRYGCSLPHGALTKLQKTSLKNVEKTMSALAQKKVKDVSLPGR